MMTKSNPSSLTAIGPEEPFVPTLCLIRGFGLIAAARCSPASTCHDGSQMMTKSNISSPTVTLGPTPTCVTTPVQVRRGFLSTGFRHSV